METYNPLELSLSLLVADHHVTAETWMTLGESWRAAAQYLGDVAIVRGDLSVIAFRISGRWNFGEPELYELVYPRAFTSCFGTSWLLLPNGGPLFW